MARRSNQAAFNLFLIAAIIALFGVGIYLLMQAQKGPTSIVPAKLIVKNPEKDKQAYLDAINAKYEPGTLQYEDRMYGYKLRYPIGYDAVLEPFPGIHQRFAAFYPPFSMELIDIRILTPADLTVNGVLDAAKEFNAPVNTQTINGKQAYLISTKLPSLTDDLEDTYIRQAFFQCKNSTGFQYWLSYTAGISEALSADLELADYMIYSIEC
ncbi:MAG: hypothetical protein ABH863_05380 [Candidatus Micrarchaeota archaeon]